MPINDKSGVWYMQFTTLPCNNNLVLSVFVFDGMIQETGHESDVEHIIHQI